MKIKVSARMAHWGIRLASLGIALGFVGNAQPVVQAHCGIYCVTGESGCASNAHYAYTSNFGTRDGDPHFECYESSCDSGHAQCGVPIPAEDLNVLEHAAIAGDSAKMESMLDEYRTLTVNTERSALQVLDCRGDVVAHIPVSSTLISGLSAATRR